MLRMLRNSRGFTMIEMIMVIVIVAVLSVVAIPIYNDLTAKAKQASEDAVVGGVRSGLQSYFVKQLRDTGAGSYPSTLDAVAINTNCLTATPCFTSILSGGGVTGGSWKTGASARTYISPVTTSLTYDSAAGTFQ